MTQGVLVKLAEAAKLLLLERNRGRCKAEEITKKAYGEVPFWRTVIVDVQKRLHKIKAAIESEDGSAMHIVLVAENWWSAGCPTPTTLEEARSYLPGGYNKPAYGFYLVTKENDPMWLVTMEKGEKSPIGRLNNWSQEVNRASRDGFISLDHGKHLLTNAKDAAFPASKLKNRPKK